MAQQAPLTQTQLPNDSILDLFNKQTYLGNTFTLPAAGTSLTDTTETVIAVISNASTNTKSLFLFSRMIMSNNNPVLARFYKSPTLNVAGSATVPLNVRLGSTATTVSTCYLSATLTSNGTLLETIPATTYGVKSNVMIIIDPGTKIAVTAQQAAAGTSLVIPELAWYEI